MSEEKVVSILAGEVTQKDLEDWYNLQKQLEILVPREMELRKKIFAFYFKNPKEGVNTQPLQEGWVLKATHKINYKLDLALYAAHKQEFVDLCIPLDELVKYKPEMSVSEYKKLTPEQKKAFDTVLESKPGSPSMEIVLPKRK